MNEPSSSMSWKFRHQSDTRPCGYWTGTQLVCIMSSLSTMICSMTWMALCEFWPKQRHNGRKPDTLLWRLLTRSCPNNLPQSLQQLVRFTIQRKCLILSGICDHLGSGTRRGILILRKRRRIVRNTRGPFRSMWTTNNARNIDEYPSLKPKLISAATSSPLQRILYLVNRVSIHMICPAIRMNT